MVIVSVSIGCAQVRELVQVNSNSERVNEFNYSVPFGYKNAEVDPTINKETDLVIFLPGSDQIMLRDIESVTVDMKTLGESVRAYADGKPEFEKAIYIAARYDIDAAFLDQVLNELRKQDINTVRLLISSAERRKDSYGNEGIYHRSMGDIPAPDRVFEVAIRTKVLVGAKPNPLTLLVRLGSDRKPNLNNESYADEDKLSSTLAEAFKSREQIGVFRENTNEVEKTVLFQIDEKSPDSTITYKYVDLLRLIDAFKGAGASPIVLTDKDRLWQIAASPEPSMQPSQLTPPTRKVPPMVSGGVLNGKATYLPHPAYPPAARAVRASGTVTVQVTVDENGSVIDSKAVSGHPLLRSSAEQAARSAKFAPTTLSGQRVKVSGVLVFNFEPAS